MQEIAICMASMQQRYSAWLVVLVYAKHGQEFSFVPHRKQLTAAIYLFYTCSCLSGSLQIP